MSIESLLDINKEITDLWEVLSGQDPGTVDRLQDLLTEKSTSIDKAKSELRGLGVGTHEFGGFIFKVSSGPTKSIFNLEDVLDEAEDRGHLQDLLAAGFVTYSINSGQLDRLPDQLRAVYADLLEEKAGTPRVTIPKGLK